VELSKLPLEPIADLKAKSEQIEKKDRERRLKQILSLPLAEMTQYTREKENGKVLCTLCQDDDEANLSHHKEEWADIHFRLSHWERYCNMKGISPDVDKIPPSIASYMAPESQSSIPESVSVPLSRILPSD